jgi:urease alpha subunit
MSGCCPITPALPPLSACRVKRRSKGVTLYPAQIFGVDKLVGSIEVGKIANLVITDGDILEFKTRVKTNAD